MSIKARLIEQLHDKLRFENNKPADVPVDWEYIHGLTDLIVDLGRALETGTEIDDYFEVVKTIRIYYYSEKYDKPVKTALNRLSKIWLL